MATPNELADQLRAIAEQVAALGPSPSPAPAPAYATAAQVNAAWAKLGPGQDLVLPAGTILCEAPLRGPKSTGFIGAGQGRTYLVPTYDGADLLAGAGDNRFSGFTLDAKDRRLTGLAPGPGSTADHFTVQSCHGSGVGAGDPGIALTDFWIAACDAGVWNCWPSATGWLILRGMIRDCRTNGIWAGGDGGLLSQVEFVGNHTQTDPVGGGQVGVGQYARSLQITSCWVHDGGAGATGVEIAGGGHDGLVGSGVVLDGLVVERNPHWGVILGDSYGHRIRNAQIRDNGGPAVQISASVPRGDLGVVIEANNQIGGQVVDLR